MAHEITERDGLVLYGTPAWHGLGTVVDKAPSPMEALRIAGLDWDVDQRAAYYAEEPTLTADGFVTTYQPIPGTVANVRRDTREVLGAVGDGYTVVQNRDVAGLVYDAAQSESVTVETAGSLRSGREVFFCAHLGTFAIGERDRSHQYALFVNAHDGTRALTVVPTSVRVVCANTKRAALSKAEASRLVVTLRHSSGLGDRLDEVRTVLRGARALVEREAEAARALAARKMTPAEVESFFSAVYARMYGAVPPADVSDRGGKAKRTRALDMAGDWSRTLGTESDMLGESPNAWLAANAVTRWIDHDRTTRGGDRLHSNLLGSAASAKDDVFAEALTLVG